MTATKKVKCVYHAADLDGYCSGAIVGHALGWDRVEFIPMNHGWKFPWEKFGPEDEVFMVDFSLQPHSLMRELYDIVGRMTWIDHHKSEIEAERRWREDYPDLEPIDGIRIVGEAACGLTWTWMCPHQFLPKAVKLLGLYDVWAWQDVEGALEFNMGMRTYGSDLDPKYCAESDNSKFRYVWDSLFLDDYAAHYHIEDVIQYGKLFLKLSNEENKKAAKGSCFQTNICDVPVIAANVGGKNSQFFDSVLEDFPEAKALMTFHYRKGKWNISLYQIEGRDTPDLSVIAGDLGLRSEHGGGGGGHAGAAGLQWHCWGLPFEVKLEPKPEKGSD
jgi:hypothetical protein